jgi:L-threonylcarbamoyladenylate synthase
VGPTVLGVDPGAPDPAAVAQAAAVLAGGGLVALPTETVYGLGADARNAAAVRRVFAVKGRPADNPLICHVADPAGLEALARHVPPLARQLAAAWWPGPLTLVVDAAPELPRETTGGRDSVAVRMPAHPVALAVLRASGLAVAAPSANRSGRPSPTTAAHVLDDLAGEVDLVLDAGPSPIGVESTVVDARGSRPVILRPGAVTAEDLGLEPASDPGADTAASPGLRYRHYAPSCRVLLAPPGRGPQRAATAAAGGRVGLVAPGPPPPGVMALAAPRDAAALAAVLFGALRRAEAAGLDVVVVEGVEDAGIGRAVMDRLRRAAGQA